VSQSALFEKVQAQIPGELLADLAKYVREVEALLEEECGSAVRLVEDVNLLTLHAGGKRIRPILAFLSALTTGLNFDRGRVVKIGACLEMIHMATLIHDDVIDGAATRRGKPTASAIHGATASVLSGDVLLSKAMRILAMDGDLSLIRLVSEAVVEMAEGEVRELEVRGDFDLDEEEHMRVLRMKTAAFIECCCRAGILLCDQATEAMEIAAGQYGHHLGLAFQVADDLLDFRGDHVKTGKPRATDFREGSATLPLIYLRPSLSEEELAFTRCKFGNGVTDAEVDMIAGWMDVRGAYVQAESEAYRLADEAQASLASFPHAPARVLLETVSDFVVAREA
jgi:octaprenyl-diphosphate synthase